MIEDMRTEHHLVDAGALHKCADALLYLIRVANDCFAQGVRGS